MWAPVVDKTLEGILFGPEGVGIREHPGAAVRAGSIHYQALSGPGTFPCQFGHSSVDPSVGDEGTIDMQELVGGPVGGLSTPQPAV